MVENVSFKNFRRFSNFPSLEMGDINIFVGRNNAGKSTVLKALQLMKGNLNTLSNISNSRNIFASTQPKFVFDVDELAELHIDNFERALYNKANRKEITLSATINGCSYTIVLNGQGIEKNRNFVAVPYTVIQLENDDLYLNFNFQTRDLHMVIKSPNDFIKDKMQDEIEKLTSEKESLLSKSKELSNAIKVYRDKLETKSTELNNDIKYYSAQLDAKSKKEHSLSEINDLISSVGKTEHHIKALKSQIDSLDKEIDYIKSESKRGKKVDISSLPEFSDTVRVNIIEQIFNNIFQYASTELILDKRTSDYKNVYENQRMIKESIGTLQKASKLFVTTLSDFQLEYIHAHAASQKVIYLKEEKMDVLSKSISEFCKESIALGDEEWQFIKKWMGKDQFEVGDDFEIEDVQSAGYSVKIIDEGKKQNLADKGTGSIQIMTLLFSLAVIMRKVNDGLYFPTVLVEEPEQNIHPMLQSKLADMFKAFWKSISKKRKSQLIIETHSEYLIRKTQVLVAEEHYEDENILNDNNPFKVFYFEKDNLKQPFYQMTYNVNGRFKESFGYGFYDEAGKLALDLSQNNYSEIKSDDFNWSKL